MRSFAIYTALIGLLFVPVAFVQATVTSGGGGTVTSGGSSSGVTLINPLNTGSCSGSTGNCLENFLVSILDFVVRIGAIVVILMLVYVGFKFVTAQGSDSKIAEARTMLLWTIVGALILLGAKVIAMGIRATVQSLGG